MRLRTGGAEINFETEVYSLSLAQSVDIPLNNVEQAAFTLTNQLAANSADPLFHVMSVEFVQQVNAKFYPLSNGPFNSISLLAVSEPA